ncbi:MAG TPA: hypothetical protein VMM12_03945 [Longimicrobiales bacterium]|nr:hypothetical protein [Longimicrobiales bacterium]
MRRGLLVLAAAVAAAAASGCGGGDVAVVAALEGEAAGAGTDGAVALGSLEIRLLPYDRDAIFDSLTGAYSQPEPQLPDSVARLQDLVSQRQQEWRQAEGRWGLLRDSLKAIADRMNQMDQRSGQYFALFQDFNALDDEVQTLETRSREAFQEFSSLQTRLNQQSQEIRLRHRAWADEAYAPVDSIIEARLEETGLEELADTTDAQGVARFRGVRPGQWWVHARFDRQYDELYWNEPIEVPRGEELVVRLNRDNAEVRQKM